MTPLAVCLLLAVGADRGEVRPELALRLTITPVPDRGGRWCKAPRFQAVLTNTAGRPLWLALDRSGDLEVSIYSFSYSGRAEGELRGRSHDGTTMGFLRSSQALAMKAGESLIRKIDLDGARLRAGKVHVYIAARVHGTDDLSATEPQRYELQATVELTLRRRGRCFEVALRLI
jgi:hypothetical protein